jgi:hypothetical protein
MFENPTVNLNAFCKSCVKLACFSSDLIVTFLYESSSIQNTSEQFVSYIQVSFVNVALYPAPQQNSNGVRSGDSNNSILVAIQN